MKLKFQQIIDDLNRFVLYTIVLIIPLIVYHKFYELCPDEKIFYHGTNEISDFFYYYKTKTLLILSALLFILFVIKTIRYKMLQSIYYIPILILALLTILSSLYSKHFEMAINGYFYILEGLYVLLSYLFLFVVSLNVFSNIRHIRTIILVISISAFIGAVIGILQFFNINIAFSLWELLTTYSDYDILLSDNNIGSTMSNSNYVGSWMALLIPIFFVLFTFLKNNKYKFWYALVFYFSSALLIISKSRGGYLAIIITTIIYIIFMFPMLKFYIKNLFFIIPVIFLLFAVKTFENKNLTSESPHAEGIANHTKLYINNLEINENILLFETSIGRLKFVTQKNKLSILDDNDVAIRYIINKKGIIKTHNELLKQFLLKIVYFEKKPTLSIKKDKFELYFVIKDNRFYYFDKNRTLKKQFPNVNSFGFERKEYLGSGRGFIWSRTFPLLTKNFFLGAGPDNFVYIFPQDDYRGKINAFGTQMPIVNKPHNWFLNTAINTGFYPY